MVLKDCEGEENGNLEGEYDDDGEENEYGEYGVKEKRYCGRISMMGEVINDGLENQIMGEKDER